MQKLASSKIKGLTIEIGGDTTGLGNALKNVDKQMTTASTSLKDINRLLKLDPTNAELLTQKLYALSSQINSTKERLKLLQQAEAKAQEQAAKSDEGKEAYEALRREIIATEQNLKKLSAEATETNISLRSAGRGAKDTADEVRDVGKATTDSGEKMASFGDILKGSLAAEIIHTGLQKIVDGMKEIARESVEAGSGFETAMAKVKTIADPDALSFDELEEQIQDLSTRTGTSAEEIAESVYSAISGGVDTAQAVEVVEKANQLAVGGFTDTATAIDVLTTAINAYGLSTDDAAKLSDYLLTTQNLGKTTVDELAGSMGKVIPLASAYGVQMDNLSSAYAIMTANGIATNETTTYLKAMLKELGDSGSTVSAVLAEQTGKTFAELNAEGLSLGDVLGILGDSVDGDSGKFNELWSSSEAGIGALSILGSGTEEYTRVLTAMGTSAGTAESAYATMTDTYEHKSEELKNTLTNLEIEGFNGFKAAVKDTMSAVNKELQSQKTKKAVSDLGASVGKLVSSASQIAVKWLPKISSAMSFCVDNLGKLTTAGVTAYTAAKGMKIGAKLGNILSKIKGVSGGVCGLWGILKANPIGAVITAVSTLVSVISALDAAIETQAERDAAETKRLQDLATEYSDLAKTASDAQQARIDAAKVTNEEYDGYQDLWDELQDLVDANGNVIKGNEARVNVITGLLSEGTGIEIELIDGTIQKYDELCNSIDRVIEKERAKALLSGMESDYNAEKEGYGEKQADYEAALSEYSAMKSRYDDLISREAELRELSTHDLDSNDAQAVRDELMLIYDELYGLNMDYGIDTTTGKPTRGIDENSLAARLPVAEKSLEDARYTLDTATAVISNYEALQEAILTGDPEALAQAVADASNSLLHAEDSALSSLQTQQEAAEESYDNLVAWSKQDNSSVTAEQVDEAMQLKIAAMLETYKKMLAEGDSITGEELEQQRQALVKALIESGDYTIAEAKKIVEGISGEITDGFAGAEDEAREIGEHYGEGLAAGIESKRERVGEASRETASMAIRSTRGTLEIASPSKAGRRLGRNFGESLALGVTDEEDAAAESAVSLAQRLAQAMDGSLPVPVDIYTRQISGIAGQQAGAAAPGTGTDGTMQRLDRIYEAIKASRLMVVLDDGTLVGHIAPQIDGLLGEAAAEQNRGGLS